MRTLEAVLIVVLLLSSGEALSQPKPMYKGSFQLNLGLSKTLHYNQPVRILACIEGCYPSEQRARTARNLEMGYYRTLNYKNELKLSTGFTEYRFWEKGMASDGGGILNPYTWIVTSYYLDFSMGYRYTFPADKRVRPFLESQLTYELLTSSDRVLKPRSFATSLKFGGILDASKGRSLIISAYFKSGVSRYNKEGYGEAYVPFAIGVEVGVIWGSGQIH